MLAAMRDRLLAAVAALSLLSACAGTAPQPSGAARNGEAVPAAGDPRAASTSNAPGNQAARLAVRMVGVPYRYGGADPKEGFDCSGLVYYTYTKNGYAVPRTAQDLFKAARKISLEDAIEGDLVFFQDQAKLSHVGIYLGEGMFVHAPSSGSTVAVSSLDTAYYRRHLVAVGRLSPRRL